MSVSIWWIRRDLRLTDNQALAKAMERAEMVLPVFILDSHLLHSTRSSQKRIAFLLQGLRSLDEALRQCGSRLIVRQGDPLAELSSLYRETSAVGIFAQADISPYARWRDERVKQEILLELTPGVTVYTPETVLKPDGLPYTVFTPFSRKWRSLPVPGKPLPAPERLLPPPSIYGGEIGEQRQSSMTDHFIASEAEAQRKLDSFIGSAIGNYAVTRDRLDIEGTSGLSPYIKFGMISARQAAWLAYDAAVRAEQAEEKQGAQTWLNELIWREFFSAILYNFPKVLKAPFQRRSTGKVWLEDEVGFTAWKEGCTGIPVVDAAMRQLKETGWMHNRARMITASFLVKDLLIDWRLGEKYFMQHLLDGDPASNNGGWQWIAGTGTDAAPFYRIFNPILQGRKFDPQGNYVRRWIPELARIPETYIHTPWIMPAVMQSKLNCRIGKDYPAPIVDHTFARQRARDAYQRNKY